MYCLYLNGRACDYRAKTLADALQYLTDHVTRWPLRYQTWAIWHLTDMRFVAESAR